MRTDLVKELNKITTLKDKIYPTNAPQGTKGPYLVYMVKLRENKDLDGYNGSKEADVMLNIMTASYSEMVALTKEVEDLVKNLINKKLEKIYVEDINLDNTSDVFENELLVYRGIVPFTMYFKEEE